MKGIENRACTSATDQRPGFCSTAAVGAVRRRESTEMVATVLMAF
jgi:hypothetical protein